ncbi:hypothetical protein K3495_g11033 [Podosphaera aphanis]|nr:hypothetical protein K3495_g11033 [Podosphaera aphanis]
MKLINVYSVSLISLIATARGAAVKRAGPSCQDIKIPVSINPKNVKIDTSRKDLSTVDGLKQTLDGILSDNLKGNTNTEYADVNGNYMIAARFCEPGTKNSTRAKTVQMLVHGITYSKDYWSGLGPPGQGFDGDTYSYIESSSKQGYPTLSIDRLGNGDSDRPDGFREVQINSHVEVTEAIAKSLKAGSIGGRSFDKMIYVGHSYGSMIGNLHAVKYPDTFNSYVLTGFSTRVKTSLIPTLLTGGFLPAQIAFPEKLSDQSLSYYAASNEDGAASLFFVDKNTDPNLLTRNFQQRGTVTVGEFISGFESAQAATNYKGRVLVFNGQNDAIFCSPDSFGKGTLNGKGDCGTGDDSIIAETGKEYPAAAVFDYMTVPDVGHCNILHKNAQEQFDMINRWIEDNN